MFVRSKRNASGSTSVQIIDKSDGYKVVRSLGSSQNPDEIRRLVRQGWQIIHAAEAGQQQLLAISSQTEDAVKTFVGNLGNAQIRTVGPEMIFGTLFDRLGFNEIPDELFRHLVIARLAWPGSKLKTVDYLRRFRGVVTEVQAIYRFLDRLADQHKETVQAIAYRHTRRRLGTVTVVFYDVTTLYFESEDEDDWRKIGWSKDGKFARPQIVLGLLVGEYGLPIGYNLFEGNTVESKTLLPVLKAVQQQYGLGQPVVVADAGLLSDKNLAALKEQGFSFILRARLKNTSIATKTKILTAAKQLKDGDSLEVTSEGGDRLVVTYSRVRAERDAKQRERGLKRLRAKVKSGRLTKAHINLHGYNKFLAVKGVATITVDEEKIKADSAWDGLKGYVTNTQLPPKKIVASYGQLWQIEKAFRISKTDLRVRPIHHWRRRRIEAHICLAFVAYAIYKELEYLLKKNKAPLSVKRAAELTHTMYALQYTLPGGQDILTANLQLDEEQELLRRIVCG